MPLNSELREALGLKPEEFKYYYDSVNEVHLDFQQFHTTYYHKQVPNYLVLLGYMRLAFRCSYRLF